MGAILCDTADVEERLGRTMNTEETGAWKGIAREATVLIEGYLDKEWPDDDADDDTVPAAVPMNVRVVCSRMTARTLVAPGSAPGGALAGGLPPGTKSFNSSMGPLGHTTTFGDDVVFGSPWLSKADKMMLRRRRYAEHVPMYPTPTVGQGDWPS